MTPVYHLSEGRTVRPPNDAGTTLSKGRTAGRPTKGWTGHNSGATGANDRRQPGQGGGGGDRGSGGGIPFCGRRRRPKWRHYPPANGEEADLIYHNADR